MDGKNTVVRLQGGMGNQMFQYAFGRALSLRNNSDLYLDASALNPKKNRGYSLDNFLIGAKFATPDVLKSAITPHFALKKKLWKALKIPFKYAPTHIVEKRFSYSAEISETKTSAYFDGYWQTEKYFADCPDIIRGDFAFRNEPELQKHPQYGEICGSESVAVHIRRGDYVKNPKYRKLLYVCGLEYYARAIAYLRERRSGLKFFIASDDPKWVAENFDLSADFRLIESKSAIEDFYLMSRCRHNIISNSSFGWWSAWLNGNPQKTVIAPAAWFAAGSGMDYSDVVPDEWIKIETTPPGRTVFAHGGQTQQKSK